MFSFFRRKWIPILFVGIISLRVVYYWRSDGFSLPRIENNFPNVYQLAKPSQEKLQELTAICQMKFHYLGKGSQAYAFESEDGQYVLKLIKCYHLKPIPWLENLVIPGFIGNYVKQHLKRRYQKTKLSFESYRIAHDQIPDECGLVFLQIVPSDYFHQPVTFTDKIGRTFTINLENHGFLIQKKVDLIFPTLDRFIENGEMEQAKKLMHSIVNLIVARSKKGVSDQDPDIHKNCGCVGTEAQFIDVGSFHANARAKLPETYIQDTRKITRKLKNFLEERSPELVEALEREIAAFASNTETQRHRDSPHE